MDNVVAIYNRLSEEDKDKLSKEEESRSIQNQKSMLISYALSQGWEIFNIYSDDDFKGSDRSRPAFNQLLTDAEAGKFNIVLCKSQARFTRELELVEKIIHGQFVEWGIRFVGYADNADTANKGNKKSRQINGLVNEWYLEDLSDNIKTVLTDYRKKGMHIGAFAPYGYQKDPEQKGHLIIDPEAAAVVQKVFTLYASGMGRSAIARLLNEEGIPNPTEYKRQQGLRYQNPPGKYGCLWKYFSITDMLENEVYHGHMVQGKYENRTYKSKHSKPVPKERWIRVENTHEPIIDDELWEKVQQRLKEKTRPMCCGKIGVFAGKTRCMYCGYTLSSSKTREYYYLKCPSKQYSSEACQGAFIAQRMLTQEVLKELNAIMDTYFNENAAESSIMLHQNYEVRRKKLLKERNVYQHKSADLKRALQNMYVDKAKGIISEAEYFEFSESFHQDINNCRQNMETLDQQLEDLNKRCNDNVSKSDILKKYRNVTELNRDIIDTLVDYIEIGHKNEEEKGSRKVLPPIIIHWKF